MEKKIWLYCFASFFLGIPVGYFLKFLTDKNQKYEVYYPTERTKKTNKELQENPEALLSNNDDEPSDDIFDVPPIDTIDMTSSIEDTKMHQIERDDGPYIISSDDFYNSNQHFDKITITYYELDNTLADDHDEKIHDLDIIVEKFEDNFGGVSGDNDILYVRNPRLAADFEVIRVNKSYAEYVMGEETS